MTRLITPPGRAGSVIALVWLCSAAAIGSQDPASLSGSGQIAGVVTTIERESTRPVRRAIVRITSTELRGSREVVTDDAGRFLFANLPPGRFTLVASKPGHVTLAYGARSPRGAGTPIALAPGERELSLKLHLPQGAVITGTLRDWTGQPIGGVVVYERTIVDGRITLRPVASQVTESPGEYRVYGLPAGEYYIGTRVSSPFTDGAIPTTAALVRWADQQRLGLAGAAVAVPPESRAAAFVPVFFPGVTQFSDAQPVVVGEGEERRGVDFAVRLVPALSVSGVIRWPDGRPAAGLSLSVMPAGDEPLVPFSSRPRGVTNANGEFVLSNIVPASYVITSQASVDAPQLGRDAGSPANFFAAERLEVAGNVAGLVLTLQPGVGIRGRLDMARLAEPADPGRIRVSASSTRSNLTTVTRQSGIKADGTFELAGLPAGQYRLSIATSEAGQSGRRSWIPESITLAGADMLDRPIDVPAGTGLDGIVVTLTDKVAQLSGRLVDAKTQAVPNLAVILFPTDAGQWTTSSSRRPVTARAGRDGTYRFDGLNAGTYYIAAAVEIDSAQLTDAAYLNQFIPGAVKITIALGEQKVQDLRIGTTGGAIFRAALSVR